MCPVPLSPRSVRDLKRTVLSYAWPHRPSAQELRHGRAAWIRVHGKQFDRHRAGQPSRRQAQCLCQESSRALSHPMADGGITISCTRHQSLGAAHEGPWKVHHHNRDYRENSILFAFRKKMLRPRPHYQSRTSDRNRVQRRARLR